MNKSDPQDMALEALEALQKDLASASGDVRKELALMASVIDQKRAEEKKERESQVQEAGQRSVQTESAQPDPTVTPKEAERESTPRGATFQTIEVQDKWGEHKPFSGQAVKTATEAFFYFVVLGPGLIFFLLMAALFYDFSLFSN